jgi:DNA-binding NtrC family response regulator
VITARPALVICDLEMPVGSGWDLLIYCHDYWPKIPVILISGGALGKRPEIECLAAGTFDKPLDLGRLRAEIKRLVSHTA